MYRPPAWSTRSTIRPLAHTTRSYAHKLGHVGAYLVQAVKFESCMSVINATLCFARVTPM